MLEFGISDFVHDEAHISSPLLAEHICLRIDVMVLDKVRRYHPLPDLGMRHSNAHKRIATTLANSKVLDGPEGPISYVHVLYLGSKTTPSSEANLQRAGSLRISWIVVATPST